MTATVVQGDARRLPLPDRSVHCCITSPPYFGLRDYGTAIWEGGDAACDHCQPVSFQSSTLGASTGGRSVETHSRSIGAQASPYRDTCGKCGARRVDRQIGLEATPDEFVAAMVQVFREVRRVLRDDGTCWLNLGDSFNSAGTANKNGSGASGLKRDGRNESGRLRTNAATSSGLMSAGTRKDLLRGLKPKDLIGIPWRVAFALQADGWYLRSDIIWAKPNPMPESVTDRPTKSHEYIFMLSKQERYFFDAEAVRETSKDKKERLIENPSEASWGTGRNTGRLSDWKDKDYGCPESGRNIRSVWTIATESFPGSHFATFPRALVEPCVKAGTSERGCCPCCGAPWVRQVERERLAPAAPSGMREIGRWSDEQESDLGGRCRTTTTGWRQSCPCPAREPIPCTVLDPFAGSGTTGVVATALNRNFVGVELSADYARMAVRRISRPHARHRTAREEYHPLFAGVSE